MGGEGREADGSAGEGGGDGLKRGRFELAELFENTGDSRVQHGEGWSRER